jgi:hypothetical protein
MAIPTHTTYLFSEFYYAECFQLFKSCAWELMSNKGIIEKDFSKNTFTIFDPLTRISKDFIYSFSNVTDNYLIYFFRSADGYMAEIKITLVHFKN